jgi:pimeloyl-ACP methyl ester carboxylesterase
MDKINQQLILEDGRNLGFTEYGDPVGKPVFHFHGAASSRLERPASEDILKKLDIRFISEDHPGHGLSDYQPNRHLLDWPGDIHQLAGHLGFGEFYVTGYSSGGPYSLACAYQLAERVIAGAAISSLAPMSRKHAYEGMPFFEPFIGMDLP